MTINFELPKVSKMTSLKIYLSPVMGEARNIKLGQQVNLIQRVQLNTPHQEVVISLPHNHVTSSLSLVTGATVIKFRQ